MDEYNELENLKSDFEALRHILSHSFKDPLRMAVKAIDKGQMKKSKRLINNTINAMDKFKDYAFIQDNYYDYKEFSPIEVIDKATNKHKKIIESSKAKIKVGNLPKIIKAQRELIEIVFDELISNSLKFRSKKIPQIEINAKKKNKMYEFTIKDNGIGMEEIFTIIIFKPFQKVDPENNEESLGLGLAYCHKILALHGGRIWFESEDIDGKGCTFYFTIPAN